MPVERHSHSTFIHDTFICSDSSPTFIYHLIPHGSTFRNHSTTSFEIFYCYSICCVHSLWLFILTLITCYLFDWWWHCLFGISFIIHLLIHLIHCYIPIRCDIPRDDKWYSLTDSLSMTTFLSIHCYLIPLSIHSMIDTLLTIQYSDVGIRFYSWLIFIWWLSLFPTLTIHSFIIDSLLMLFIVTFIYSCWCLFIPILIHCWFYCWYLFIDTMPFRHWYHLIRYLIWPFIHYSFVDLVVVYSFIVFISSLTLSHLHSHFSAVVHSMTISFLAIHCSFIRYSFDTSMVFLRFHILRSFVVQVTIPVFHYIFIRYRSFCSLLLMFYSFVVAMPFLRAMHSVTLLINHSLLLFYPTLEIRWPHSFICYTIHCYSIIVVTLIHLLCCLIHHSFDSLLYSFIPTLIPLVFHSMEIHLQISFICCIHYIAFFIHSTFLIDLIHLLFIYILILIHSLMTSCWYLLLHCSLLIFVLFHSFILFHLTFVLLFIHIVVVRPLLLVHSFLIPIR